MSYQQVLTDNLQVMDATSIEKCLDNEMHILVFDMTKPDEIIHAVFDEAVGTVIHS